MGSTLRRATVMWRARGADLRERDFFTGAAGSVNSVHNLERLVAVLAGNQRLAADADGLAEIQKLALEWLQRNRHRIGRSRSGILRQRRRLTGVVFHIPGCQLVAGNDGGAFGTVEFGALRVSRPEGGGGLDHAGGARGIMHHRVHYVLRFDLVQSAKLPDRIQLAHRAGQPAQDIDLVNRLVDQRAAALGLPTTLDRPRVVFRRPVPLYVTIAFEQLAQASGGDGPPQELAGIVKTVLADHAQPDARTARRFHHLARRSQVR